MPVAERVGNGSDDPFADPSSPLSPSSSHARVEDSGWWEKGLLDDEREKESDRVVDVDVETDAFACSIGQAI
jgi:hypothetical protein